MRYAEINTKNKSRKAPTTLGLKTFKAAIKLPQKGHSTLIDTQVVARNYELARRLLLAQYGPNSVISNVTEVR